MTTGGPFVGDESGFHRGPGVVPGRVSSATSTTFVTARVFGQVVPSSSRSSTQRRKTKSAIKKEQRRGSRDENTAEGKQTQEKAGTSGHSEKHANKDVAWKQMERKKKEMTLTEKL